MKIICKVGIAFLNLIYSFEKLFRVRNQIIIMSRQSNSPSLDIEMIASKIKELHPDYEVVVLCRKIGPGLSGKISYCFHMLTQMWYLATSKVCILDSYCILASVLNHRDSLLVVQMWHSVGTMKKFGYSILDKEEGSSSKVATAMKMHHGYDYILCAGEGYVNHLAQGFNYPEDKIVVLPLPRVEALKDPNRKSATLSKIYAKYPMLLDDSKKTVVYAPTFRKKDDSEFISALVDLIKEFNYDKYNLVVKAHPLTDLSGLGKTDAIIDRDFQTFDMLYAADMVISDYSCVMYEAGILDKPLYFYDYDYEEYMATRDIYMDYLAEVPGPVCYDAKSLVSSLDDTSYDMDKLRTFVNKYVKTDGKEETNAIVDFIFDRI